MTAYVWEEMRIPITYESNRQQAEEIVLKAVQRHTLKLTEQLSRESRDELRRRYFIGNDEELNPRVFLRMTGNWLELGIRFIAPDHGIHALKDAITRDILERFDAADIIIASATYSIVSVPRLRVSADDSLNRAA